MRAGKFVMKALQFLAGAAVLVICLQDISSSLQRQLSNQYLQFYNQTGQLTSEETGHCLTTRTAPEFHICPHNSSEDIYISNSLSVDGVWEPTMTKTLQDILENERNVTFIDIGANIGYFSLFAAAHGYSALAVEPIEKNLKQFHKAIVMNNYQSQILLLQNVISDTRRDRVLLALDRNNQGAARVLSDSELKDKGNAVETAVSILMVDLIGLIRTPDVIIKIDVEGHECKAIAQSSQLFRQFNVNAVFMEWQKMSHRKYIHGTACQHGEIYTLAKQLSSEGLTAYDVQRGNKLDITNSVKWTSGDVIWRRG